MARTRLKQQGMPDSSTRIPDLTREILKKHQPLPSTPRPIANWSASARLQGLPIYWTRDNNEIHCRILSEEEKSRGAQESLRILWKWVSSSMVRRPLPFAGEDGPKVHWDAKIRLIPGEWSSRRLKVPEVLLSWRGNPSTPIHAFAGYSLCNRRHIASSFDFETGESATALAKISRTACASSSRWIPVMAWSPPSPLPTRPLPRGLA